MESTEEKLMREYSLNAKQAAFCVLVASGLKPIDAVMEVYNYAEKQNAYGQLKTLIGNRKVDDACKNLGMNLKDTFEKNAFAIVKAFEDIAFGEGTATRDKLSALKELATYNPMLQTIKKKDADDREEEETAKRVQEWLNEED